MAKQYGLMLPNKHKEKLFPVSSVKPAIFNEDSDSDTPQNKPTGLTRGIKKKDKINQEKIVQDDPTVYQYDEIYDEMDKKRNESKLARKDLEKKPKYINKLVAAADRRKRETERRIERQVQKEREQEGDMYKDKESFVTSAYKNKLEELRKVEEQEKYVEYLESIGDVRKQGNLDGFYRHLYEQKVKYEDIPDNADIKNEIKEEPEDSSTTTETTLTGPAVSQEPLASFSRKRKSSENQSEHDTKVDLNKDIKKRKYRVRRNTDESDNENKYEVNDGKKEHLPSNIDADSDFSIDSSDTEDEKEKQTKIVEDKKDQVEQQPPNSETDLQIEIQKNEEVKSETVKVETVEEKKVVKPKVDIWKKRTVGDKFDEAVKRYFERKAQREMLCV